MLSHVFFVHGDPYPPNIMLRRDQRGKINGVAFVDLGTIQPAGPLTDLYGFLTLSLDATLFHNIWVVKDGKQVLVGRCCWKT